MTQEELVTTAELKINPEYERIVPPLPEQDYQELKESIKQNGFWHMHPIVINEKNEVLDGHHRYRACKELGIKPIFVVKKFDNIFDEKLYVIDSNLKRRHLKTHERAALSHERHKTLAEKARQKQEEEGKKHGELGKEHGEKGKDFGRRQGLIYKDFTPPP
jgi:ParB/RepB/Spo0J family partition protein